jgi:hypothetical protein
MTRTKYTLTDGPDGSDLCLAVLPERGSCQIRDPRISTLFLQIQTGEKLPAAFKLWQNYPNPFNPSTTIQFDLPEPGVVTLRVYDLLGREMMEILDHRPFGAGTHVAELDATKLASGIYFYQISGAGEHAHFADRKKMLLVR